MLRDIVQVQEMRQEIRRTRSRIGYCSRCGGVKECENWCWGPKLLQYIWIMIKNPKQFKFLFRNLKGEYHWAGTEPYHRYE